VGPTGPVGSAVSQNQQSYQNQQLSSSNSITSKIYSENFGGNINLLNIEGDKVSAVPVSITKNDSIITITIPEFNFDSENNYVLTNISDIPTPITRYVNYPVLFNLNKNPSTGFISFKCENDVCSLAIVNIYSGERKIHNFSGISFTYKSK